LNAFSDQPKQFDLVITDMTMPVMTGDKLTTEMNRIRSGIPIIITTGFSERIDRKKALRLGARDFLLNPILVNDLKKAILALLQHTTLVVNKT